MKKLIIVKDKEEYREGIFTVFDTFTDMTMFQRFWVCQWIIFRPKYLFDGLKKEVTEELSQEKQ